MPNRSEDAAPLSTFAANLAEVIRRSGLSVNAWAKKHTLTQSTVNRIVTGKMDPTVWQVEEIARRAGMFGWQMLVPHLDPQSPPVLREANSAERALYDRLRQTIDEIAELREGGNTSPGRFDDIPAQRFSDDQGDAHSSSTKKKGSA